ncbi:MAG: MlaD family protein [Verrucomicrobiia bacterium]
MRDTLETRLGIFFALAIIAGIIVLEMAGGLERLKGGYRIYAYFKNVHELKEGDPVKMAGMQVGRVESMSITNERVRVTLKLNSDVVVKDDSKATIKFTSVLGGQNYISIDFGTERGVKLEPNSVIETYEQPDINTLMAKLDNVATGIENVTKSFSGDRIDNLLGPLTDFVKQNSGKLGAIFGNLQTISENIANGKGTVGKLVTDDALYNSVLSTVTNFEATAVDIRAAASQASNMLAKGDIAIDNVNSLITNANSIVQRINSGQGTIGKFATDEKLYTDASEAMSNLKEILIKVNKGTGTVGRLINDDSLIKNAKTSLQKLDKAMDGLEDQGPLSVIGMAVNSLF